jgi:hypothetical protein
VSIHVSIFVRNIHCRHHSLNDEQTYEGVHEPRAAADVCESRVKYYQIACSQIIPQLLCTLALIAVC